MSISKIWQLILYLVRNNYLSKDDAKAVMLRIVDDRLFRQLLKAPDKHEEQNLFDEEAPF